MDIVIRVLIYISAVLNLVLLLSSSAIYCTMQVKTLKDEGEQLLVLSIMQVILNTVLLVARVAMSKQQPNDRHSGGSHEKYLPLQQRNRDAESHQSSTDDDDDDAAGGDRELAITFRNQFVKDEDSQPLVSFYRANNASQRNEVKMSRNPQSHRKL